MGGAEKSLEEGLMTAEDRILQHEATIAGLQLKLQRQEVLLAAMSTEIAQQQKMSAAVLGLLKEHRASEETTPVLRHKVILRNGGKMLAAREDGFPRLQQETHLTVANWRVLRNPFESSSNKVVFINESDQPEAGVLCLIDGNAELCSNGGTIRRQDVFTPLSLGGGLTAFQGHNGKFLSAHDDSTLGCDGEEITDAEKWMVEIQRDPMSSILKPLDMSMLVHD
eukprot:TRINITY_DN4812_c0_g1_i4.p1 TRINITY_DN4812_c0_g1~~TRINITY_DN4812_c0_g1_i4.p1  ORF type:complete len:224 (-),score=44.97 TRINITY_DN4812_c0_g1_i4:219-890(-)